MSYERQTCRGSPSSMLVPESALVTYESSSAGIVCHHSRTLLTDLAPQLFFWEWSFLRQVLLLSLASLELMI